MDMAVASKWIIDVFLLIVDVSIYVYNGNRHPLLSPSVVSSVMFRLIERLSSDHFCFFF